MKNNVFYISEELLLRTLQKYGKGADSKDYEYAVCIYARRLFEKQFKRPFTIVFETKPRFITTSGISQLSEEDVIKILRNDLNTDTDIDFGLAPGTPGNFSEGAYPFQLKRFIGKSINTNEKDLIEYINTKIRKYNNNNLSIIFIPELPPTEDKIIKKIHIPLVQKGLKVRNNSLYSILVFEFLDNSERLIQIWPTYDVIS